MSREEVRRFIDATETQYRALFLCLYQTGMRWDEVRNLNWEDIEWHSGDNGAIRIRKAKHWKSRVIPMTPTLKKTLEEIKQQSGLIFLSKRTGKAYHNIRKAFLRAKKGAGIERHITPHILRHSFATHLLES